MTSHRPSRPFAFRPHVSPARPFRPRIAPALPISAAPLLSLCRPRCISPPFSVSLSALSPLLSPCALLSCRMCNRLHSPRPATSCLSDLKAHDFDDRLCVHRLSPRSLTLPAPLVRPRARHTSLLAHHVPARFRCTPSQLSLPPSLSSRSILAHHVPFVPARFMHARHCSSPFLPLSLRAPRACSIHSRHRLLPLSLSLRARACSIHICMYVHHRISLLARSLALSPSRLHAPSATLASLGALGVWPLIVCPSTLSL